MFKDLFNYENNLTISGLNSTLINEYILNYYENNNKDILVVADTLYDANKIYKSMHKLNHDAYFFPMDEFATVMAISSSPDLKIIRIDTLNQLNNNKKIIITNLTGYLKYIDKNVNTLNIDFNTKRKVIIEFLESQSYVKTNLVTTTGEYAVRSFIIDIYPLNYDNPVRIEFFGEDIESIRLFDNESQISNNRIDSVKLYSFSDNKTNQKENIIDKLKEPTVFFIDYKKIINSNKNYLNSKKEFSLNDIDLFNEFEKINVEKKIFLNTLDDVAIKDKVHKYISQEMFNFNNNFDNLEKYVNDNKNNKIIIFMLTNEVLLKKNSKHVWKRY